MCLDDLVIRDTSLSFEGVNVLRETGMQEGMFC